MCEHCASTDGARRAQNCALYTSVCFVVSVPLFAMCSRLFMSVCRSQMFVNMRCRMHSLYTCEPCDVFRSPQCSPTASLLLLKFCTLSVLVSLLVHRVERNHFLCRGPLFLHSPLLFAFVRVCVPTLVRSIPIPRHNSALKSPPMICMHLSGLRHFGSCNKPSRCDGRCNRCVACTRSAE